MRYVLAALVLLGSSATAQEQAPPPDQGPLADVYACADITADADRLTCYDNAVGRVREAQTQGQFVAVDRNQVQAMRRESFGFSLPNLANLLSSRGNGDEDVDRVELQVERVIAHGDGRSTFVMSDGQRWVQVDTRRSNVQAGDTVVVRRAALGSFMLLPERSRAALRVRREG